VSSYSLYPPVPPEPEPARSGTRRAAGCLLEIVETLVLTLILFWAIQSFVAQPFQVQQQSMMDTIQDGQYVLVDRLTPHFDAYHRGDIIVFTPPNNAESPRGEPFIKRVIGIAGDTVEIHDGGVYVNGTRLVEPYVFAQDGKPQATIPNDISKWTVGQGELFVMGDHRQASTDSRVFGTIKVSDVIGRAWLRYWPLSDVAILPTSQHPELSSQAPGDSASPPASTRPSAGPSTKPKPTPRPSRTPRP
jgi:signal peptidase I